MARLALVVAACALALGGSLQLNKPTTVAPRAAAKTALGAGFGTDVRKAKKGGKKSRSSAAGLTTDNGWVPLVELECSLEAGERGRPPDKPLSVYPTKELDGGAVYVNITPKSRKAAAIDAM
ncbi:sphingolipid transporter [Aureococcus anophagefferens]|nr:sphingolipid transporter [Aureococcus anophagefferens]